MQYIWICFPAFGGFCGRPNKSLREKDQLNKRIGHEGRPPTKRLCVTQRV